MSHGAKKSSFHCQQTIACPSHSQTGFIFHANLHTPSTKAMPVHVGIADELKRKLLLKNWHKQDTSSHTDYNLLSSEKKMYSSLTNPQIILKCLYWAEHRRLLKLTLLLLTSIAGPYGERPPQAGEEKPPGQSLYFGLALYRRHPNTEWPVAVIFTVIVFFFFYSWCIIKPLH